MLSPGHFRFLNETAQLDETGWNDPAKAKLWLYNLHYFDDLNAEGAERRQSWHQDLIAGWIGGNPPTAGIGWEPYPVSLRIVNWIKWGLAGNQLGPQAIQSLATQVRWLTQRLEWHLLGNHLFINAKALIFAGLYFEGPEADSWLKVGMSILAQEFDEQILRDGGQFELSTMYHALAVEDVLDLINLSQHYENRLSPGQLKQVAHWRERLPKMLHWLDAMRHPDGRIAFFNDSAFGIAPEPEELLSYARRLNFEVEGQLKSVEHLETSGYVRLEHNKAVIIADTGPVGPDYLPGHAHADTLSFEMSLGSRRIIVNSGTSVYGLGPERMRQRSTAAHSTAVIDGYNSSDVWAGFRVGRRARPFGINIRQTGDALELECAHDGYRHLKGKPVHRRSWRLSDGSLELTDAIEGNGLHRAEIRFHLPPDIEAHLQDGDVLLVDSQSRTECVRMSFTSKTGVSVADTSWHPEFGISQRSQVITVEVAGQLPLQSISSITWTPL